MNSCLKCGDVCNCLNFYSSDGSLIVIKNGCNFDLRLDKDDLSDFAELNYNNNTRELCLVRLNGSTSCVTLSNDIQQLSLNGNVLTLSKGGGSVDLTALLTATQTPFNASSASLVITAGGVNGHSPNIELVPSSDPSNTLILGGDGKPYVPAGGKDVIINDVPGLSFTKVVSSGAITFTPVIDFSYFCSQCGPSCAALDVTVTNIGFDSFDVNVTGLLIGDTYDLSIDGGATYTLLNQTAGTINVIGLTANTTYQVVVRNHCAAGGTSLSTTEIVTTTDGADCPSPTNVAVVMTA